MKRTILAITISGICLLPPAALAEDIPSTHPNNAVQQGHIVVETAPEETERVHHGFGFGGFFKGVGKVLLGAGRITIQTAATAVSEAAETVSPNAYVQ